MVGKLISACAILFALMGTGYAKQQSPVCSPGTEYLPAMCISPLPALKAVVIEEQASEAKGESPCAQFSLSQAQVVQFFRQARLIKDENEGRAKLDWVACASRGKLFLQNGDTAQWSISPTGIGILQYESGQRLMFYCVNCKFFPSSVREK